MTLFMYVNLKQLFLVKLELKNFKQIRFVFSRDISQGSAGIGSFYVDQFQFAQYESIYKIF